MVQSSKLEAKKRGVPLTDDLVSCACSTACSTGAISFGDLNDPNSKVAKTAKNNRSYHALEEIGVKPNIFYICALFYRAPELLLGATEYSVAVDMWSFGCIVSEMLLGFPLFANEASTYQQLLEVPRAILPQLCAIWRNSAQLF